jgi:hypothetical protein
VTTAGKIVWIVLAVMEQSRSPVPPQRTAGL